MEPKLYIKTIELLSAKLCILQAILEEGLNGGIIGYETIMQQHWDLEDDKNEIKSSLGLVYSSKAGLWHLHGTLNKMVREIEEVEEWILMIKKETDLDPDEGVWDTYQSALEPENEVIVGFHNDIEKIVNRLCYSHLMRSVFTILRNSNIHKFRKLVYPCLKFLRVLDLSLVKCSQGMPSEITDLLHLRYLALSTIGSLYKLQFFKLKNLLTLIVTSWMEKCPLQLQCNILDLPQLRHVHVDKSCSQYLPCLVKKNLQTLYWLKVASSDKKPNFRMVPNLKELGIYIEGQLAPSYLGSLVHLHLLEKLKFEVGRVERFCLPTGFPPNLKKLTLSYTYLPWKEMDTIGELPHLQVLKLKDFAFCGSKWEPSKQGFRELKALLISRSNLKHWDASSNHFPVLERLVLRYCWELKQIPINFANIGTLKLIVLECCYSFLVTSAVQISSTKKLFFVGTTDCPLHVREVRTKVELPNNESFEEEILVNSKEENVESVKSSEEESVESFEEIVESSEEESVKSSKEECVGSSMVELLNNESFEEEFVVNSEEENVESVKSSEEESVESFEEIVESSKIESVKSSKEESVGSSKQECIGSSMVELPNNESSEEQSVESSKEESVGRYKELSVGCSDQERLKARKRVMKNLKKKVSKSLNAFKDLKSKVLRRK
nr:putative late blight resistance protein homolog R1A-3 isoform X1 [Ipomoea trifida]